MRVSGNFPYFFFIMKFTRRKSIKCKQATFTQIFYAHKKHKKQLQLIFYMSKKHKKHKMQQVLQMLLTRNKKMSFIQLF